MGCGHQQLRPLDDVILLGVVFEEDVVVVGAWPVGDAVQHPLMVFQCPL